ncbi:MAG TPA: S41 family peptidase [Clostridia bacterium]|nr:S41 family peptidase [Clostridia bacterium]
MKKLICCILVVLFLLLSACASGSDFDTVLREANALHKAQLNMVPESSIHDFIPSLLETDVGFTEEELVSLTKSLNQSFNGEKRVTLTQAKQDVDLLFRVLHYCYGAYEYFGGDEVFDEAKDAVLNDLGALGNAFEVRDMETVLRNNLAFIQDGHFYMNYSPLPEMQSYFSTEELIFQLDKGGYFAQVDGEKQYLLSVDGNTDLEDYMKLSIGSDGWLTYRLGMLSDTNLRSKLINAAFEQTTVSLMLNNAADAQSYDQTLAYSEDWKGEVPVVACRDYTQEDAFRSFVSAAIRLREEPVAILDLRGNGGGDGGAVQAWLNNYDYNGIAKNLYGKGAFYISSRAAGYLISYNLSSYSFPTKSSDKYYEVLMNLYQRGMNGHILMKDDAKLRWNNPNGLLFVLMDSDTMSGGELLLAALRTRGNVVFVGTNSAGMILGSGGQNIALPNSKIHIGFGNSLLLSYDERVFQEGRGFLPDIWVSGDALERVKALISYYQEA